MATNKMTTTSKLKAVLAYLEEQWSKLFRLTTIEQAIRALGYPMDDELRRRVGAELLAKAAFHPTLAQWGAYTFILNEDEKLLARWLVQRTKNSNSQLTISEVAASLNCTEATVEHQVKNLQGVGLLLGGSPQNTSFFEYRFVPEWKKLAGPLEFNFHTVQRETGEQFNVPCAFDYLLLARSEFAHEKLEIFDSCVHCTVRLNFMIDNGQIEEVNPPQTLIFRGGG